MDREHSTKAPSMTVNDHVREMAFRFGVSAAAMVAAGTVIYLFYGPILAFLSAPLKAPLFYNTPAGSFTFVIKICFMGAVTLSTPIIVYNAIMFIRPALSKRISVRRVIVTSAFSSLLAICGAAFAYYVILPSSLEFFDSFRVSSIKSLISADNYLSFLTSIIVTFVIIFQIPLLLLFIDKIKPLRPKKLLSVEKWVIVTSLVIAILAPFTYDLVTSLLLAVPIVALYNLSVLLIVIKRIREKHTMPATVAVIAQPSIESPIIITEQLIILFAKELSRMDKPVVLPPIPTTNPSMELYKTFKTEKVEVPDWVKEREARRQALLNTSVNAFKDIKPVHYKPLSL